MSVSDLDLRNTISDNRLVGMWRTMAGFRLAYLGAVTGVGVAATLRTANYLLLRYFVDDVLPENDASRVLPAIALGFVMLALVQGAFTFLSGRMAARTAEGIALRLRNYLYDHIQRLSFTYHDKTQTGEMIQRVTSDVDAVRRFFADQAIGVGRIVLLFTVNFVALLTLNARLALLSVLVVPLVVIISIFFPIW